jgi:hypothetical protein
LSRSAIAVVTGSEVKGAEVMGAEVMGAEVMGAEVTGAEVVERATGRRVLDAAGFSVFSEMKRMGRVPITTSTHGTMPTARAFAGAEGRGATESSGAGVSSA